MVPRRSEVEVLGWEKTESIVGTFLVSPYKEGVAAKLGRLDSIGTITATFHRIWRTDEAPPSDEPSVKRIKVKPVMVFRVRQVMAPDGTVRTEQTAERVLEQTVVSTNIGRDVVRPSRGVKRTIGIERASISLRYEETKQLTQPASSAR